MKRPARKGGSFFIQDILLLIMTSQNMHFLEINRADIKQHRMVTVEQDSTLPHDHVLLKLDRFALTSNNISYALS